MKPDLTGYHLVLALLAAQRAKIILDGVAGRLPCTKGTP